jgi:hypothetical protein
MHHHHHQMKQDQDEHCDFVNFTCIKDSTYLLSAIMCGALVVLPTVTVLGYCTISK